MPARDHRHWWRRRFGAHFREVEHDIGATTTGLFDCPGCGASELTAMSDGELTNFLCRGCGRCWHVELGWVHEVDPATCLTCPHRDECISRQALRV